LRSIRNSGNSLSAARWRIGEEFLPLPEAVVLLGDRLLDLNDQVGSLEDLVGALDHAPPGTLVLLDREAATVARPGLDVDFVAVVELVHHGVGLHRDPTLLVLDLLRNPYRRRHEATSRPLA
jgi:hypothetical protein